MWNTSPRPQRNHTATGASPYFSPSSRLVMSTSTRSLSTMLMGYEEASSHHCGSS